MSPSLIEKIANLPNGPGCYLYKDAEARVIYVGKAKNLRKRVSSYFQDKIGHPSRTLRLVSEVIDLELIETDSEVEALLVENSLIKDLQPRFNVKLKDDKSFPLIAISREEFPKVFCTRDSATPGVDLIGPFTSATELYRAFHFLQRVFRFRVCDLDIRDADPVRRTFTPCLNWHIKRCSAPCTLRINKSDYLDDIRALRAFLSGRGKAEVVAALTARMKENAAVLRFEDAARCRDQLTAIDRLKQRGNLKDYDEPDAPVIDLHSGMLSLQQHLGLAAPPKVIEGFDIAHLMGTHVVAAQVQFVSGVPNKDGYRRFKVQGEDGDPGNNDFAAMREVVGRRYRRLRDEGATMPDVVMIDGGHGQVKMAMDALREVGVTLNCVVGLAKAEETIIRSSGEELRLSRRDPGLKLLQYVRDEAHRFCRRYLHLLKAKEIAPAKPKTAKPQRVRKSPPARRDTPAVTPPSTDGTER